MSVDDVLWRECSASIREVNIEEENLILMQIQKL